MTAPNALTAITSLMPEGVEFVDLKVAEDGDYELVTERGPDGQPVKRIYSGARVGASSGVLVKPALGYRFAADIRQFGVFIPVKQFSEAVTISAAVKFTVSDSLEQDQVKQALEKLKALSGFQELTGV